MRDGALKTGEVLKGRYTIKSILGQGAFGVVYVADDISIAGAEWAIKEIWEGSLSTDERLEALELFRKEFNILKNLNHTGVPKVVDCFSEGARHYMVMERIEGRTLEKILDEGVPELRSVLTWALKICDILEHLHSSGPSPLIFRDLKPSNVMVTPRGRVLLVDFGIARFFNPEKSKDTCELGTPGFCSPEQYGTCQSDARSDIYSLGATLYHLLCREDLARYNFKIPPVRNFNSAVPEALERILSKCLEMDAKKRYQSIRELRLQLQSVESLLLHSAAIKSQAAPAAVIPQQAAFHWLKMVPVPVILWLLFFICLILGPFTFISFAGAFLIFLALPVVSLALLPGYIRRKLFFQLVVAILSIIIPVFFIVFPFLYGNFNDGKGVGKLTACRSNLRNIGTALEMYSTDNHGRYPATLSRLTQEYLKSIPSCPSSFQENYRYASMTEPDVYTVWCEGKNHASQGMPEDFPEYDSITGLIEKSTQTFNCEDKTVHIRQTPINSYSDANFATCTGNLKNISTALEMYRTDNHDQYPRTLYELVPHYLPFLPVCPSAGSTTYGYTGNKAEDSYTVWCSGTYHIEKTGRADFPQYDSIQGLRK
ncbi:MAG: protein kinase [Candidatus Xenobiia bacterium LiM19]